MNLEESKKAKGMAHGRDWTKERERDRWCNFVSRLKIYKLKESGLSKPREQACKQWPPQSLLQSLAWLLLVRDYTWEVKEAFHPKLIPTTVFITESEADKDSHLSSISLSSVYLLIIIYHLFTYISLSPLFSINLSSLPTYLLIITYLLSLSPMYVSQSPITDYYQLLSVLSIWFTCLPSMITYLSSPIIYLRIVFLFACHSFSAICNEDEIPLNSPSRHFLLSFHSPS